MSIRVKRLPSIVALVIFAGALVSVVAQPAYANAPTCAFGNYYAQAASGTGNYGTADQIWTWKNWSVYDPAGHNFSDEAVWSIDYNNNNNALEVGFFSGWGNDNIGGDPTWSNGMIPYYTTGNGAMEYDEWGSDLPANTYINMMAGAFNTYSLVNVGGQLNIDINYVVDQPRWNFTQGETNNTATWMGGGTGDSSTLYWINSSGDLNHWSYLNDCAISPYWASSSNGTYYFANGGY